MKLTRGNSLVEVVVAAALLSAVAVSFLGAFSFLSRSHQRDTFAIKAALLAEEGIEALRYVKGAGWSNLSAVVGQTRYLELGPSSWALSTEPEVVDGQFYRSVAVSAVSRGASGDIVASGGAVDSGTLLLTSAVSWNWRGATSTVTYRSYVTNL